VIKESEKATVAMLLSQLDPSPLRRTRAYQLAEEEEGLSDNELAGVAEVFESSNAADAYLAFKNKAAQAQWLKRKVEQLK